MQALSSIVGSLSLPSAAIMEWLDSHVQVRMSILFAYMFGKSQLFAQLLTWLAQTWAPVRAALDPLFVVLGCVPIISSKRRGEKERALMHCLCHCCAGFMDEEYTHSSPALLSRLVMLYAP